MKHIKRYNYSLTDSIFNQPPFGDSFQTFGAVSNTNKHADSWRHRHPQLQVGRGFYSGSRLLGVYLSFVITIQ